MSKSRGIITDTSITRRGILKGSTALGAAALILPYGTRRAAAEPKKGGTIRVAFYGKKITERIPFELVDTFLDQQQA